jgi:hypothetical protein
MFKVCCSLRLFTDLILYLNPKAVGYGDTGWGQVIHASKRRNSALNVCALSYEISASFPLHSQNQRDIQRYNFQSPLAQSLTFYGSTSRYCLLLTLCYSSQINQTSLFSKCLVQLVSYSSVWVGWDLLPGAGKMLSHREHFITHVEDLWLVPRTHTGQFTAPVTSVPLDLTAVF